MPRKHNKLKVSENNQQQLKPQVTNTKFETTSNKHEIWNHKHEIWHVDLAKFQMFHVWWAPNGVEDDE